MSERQPEGPRSPERLPRKSRDPESAQQRDERIAREAHDRSKRRSAEDDAMDAAVRQSIDHHGA
jgi:hypothetical protein